MAMQFRRYGAECIALCSMSRATLDSTGRHQRAISHPISPRQLPWLSIFDPKNRVVTLWNHFLKLVFKKHETDPLLSSSKRQASNATINMVAEGRRWAPWSVGVWFS
jgi:hypothetical protein